MITKVKTDIRNPLRYFLDEVKMWEYNLINEVVGEDYTELEQQEVIGVEMLIKIESVILNISMLNTSTFACKSLFERAYQAVPLRRRQRIDRLKNEKDKARSLAAELVLNDCLLQNGFNVKSGVEVNDEIELENEIEIKNKVELKNIRIKNLTKKDIEKSLTDKDAFLYEIEYQHGGKPILAGSNNIYFNLSHAGDYAICVVANTPVGIDIEGKREVNDNVIKKWFSKDEKNWINENLEEKQERFFRLWTAKESVSKATGKGLAQIMEGIYFKVGDSLVLENEELKDIYNIYENDSLKSEGYCITMVVKAKNERV